MKRLLSAFVTFVALTTTSVFAQPSNRELREYVRDAWRVTSLTDEAASEVFATDYNGIPFRDWISFFLKAPEILAPLARRDYPEAASALSRLD